MRILITIMVIAVAQSLFAQKFSLPEKKDKALLNIDPAKVVMLGDNRQMTVDPTARLEAIEDSLHIAVLTKYIPVSSITLYEKQRVLAVNNMILQLYQAAFGRRRPEFLSPGRTILEVKDSALILFTGTTADKTETWENWEKWSRDHLYSYEAVLKDTTINDEHSETVLQMMQQDLNTYFKRMGISGKVENRWVTVYSLSWMPGANKALSKSKGGEETVERNALYYKQTNASIYTLTNLLNAYYWQLEKTPLTVSPAFGPDQKFDLELKAVMKDKAEVKKALERYGITIYEERQFLPMIIITQK